VGRSHPTSHMQDLRGEPTMGGKGGGKRCNHLDGKGSLALLGEGRDRSGRGGGGSVTLVRGGGGEEPFSGIQGVGYKRQVDIERTLRQHDQ